MHVIVYLLEIDIEFAGLDPELVCRPNGVRRMSGSNRGLGARTVIEAITTHLPTFDKDDVRPHLGRASATDNPPDPPPMTHISAEISFDI